MKRRGIGARTRNGMIAAVDVGTSKLCCFVARVGADGIPRVVGIGHHVSEGIRSGAVVDMESAERTILAAVSAAEEMARETIRDVIVNLSAGRPSSRSTYLEVSIAGHEVGDADVRLAMEEGRRSFEPEDRELVHAIPTGYVIDDSRGIRDPRGMYGEKLGVNLHLITAGCGAVRNLTTCIRRCHLDVEAFVLSPYASGLSCLVGDEMDLGVTLIDMGGGTTGVAVFLDGHIAHAECLPIGGVHVTHDLARGLTTPVAHAERLKTLYGSALASPSDETTLVDVPQVGEEERGEAHHVPRARLIEIIRPRIEETFELVRERLVASGFDRLAGQRVVLTGGASQLPGVRETAAAILDKHVRLGRPLRITGLAEAVNGPAFSTCAGLLAFTLQTTADTPGRLPRGEEEPGGRMARLGLWLRENL